MKNEMKLEQFVGIFPNAISDDLCSEFVHYFDTISEYNLTASTIDETNGMPASLRKDEVVCIPSDLPTSCFPKGMCRTLVQNISGFADIYKTEFIIDEPMASYDFKIHRVQPGQGYHLWHQEHAFWTSYRTLAWMIVIEAPKRGGETEFLHQSIRIEPKVGQLAIWPAGFTHKHRGNPPLEGQKTYITGWFVLTEPPYGGSNHAA
jgi:hypothetical protein